MAIREIRVVPDPVLRTPCDPIKEITPAVRHLVQDLLDTVDDPGRALQGRNAVITVILLFCCHSSSMGLKFSICWHCNTIPLQIQGFPPPAALFDGKRAVSPGNVVA